MNRMLGVVVSVKIGHKRTTLLSLVFVFVGMMFLVPAATEKALAVINASASGDCGSEGASDKCFLRCIESAAPTGCIHFDNCSYKIGEYEPCGRIASYPTSGLEVTWATRGAAFPVGTERGFVEYSVDSDKAGRVSLGFDNPIHIFDEDNHCSITHVGPGHLTYSKCIATPGNFAKITYGFRIEGIPAQTPDNTGGIGGGSGNANGGDANGGHGGNANGGDANGGVDEGDTP